MSHTRSVSGYPVVSRASGRRKQARAAYPAAEKISFAELERRLKDLDVPDRELRRFLVGDPSSSKPFAPVVQANPELVEFDEMDRFRLEGAFAMNWANGIARWRRQARFQRRRFFGERLPLVVAEGDSWFQFPFLLDDVIDQFDANYHIWCVSAAGDTLMNMVFDAPEYIEAVAAHELPRVLLFSGAGNDFVGEGSDGASVVFRVVRSFEPGRPAEWYLDTDAFRERVAFVERAYRTLLTTVDREYRGKVKVVLHGYDYAIPATTPATDPRHPSWANTDEWLGAPLGERGIKDPQLQRQIIKLMIDTLNAVQRRLCGGNVPSGTHRVGFHVDVRGTLGSVSDWADELHPTDAGFTKVARRFAPVINQLLAQPTEAAMTSGWNGETSGRNGAGVPATIDPDAIGRLVGDTVSEVLGRALSTGHSPSEAPHSLPRVRSRPESAAGADQRRSVAPEASQDADESALPRVVDRTLFDNLPLIGDRTGGAPFSDIAGVTSVDDPAHMLRGFQPEAQIAEWNTVQSGLLAALAESRRAVARIVVGPGDFVNYRGEPATGWNGTGFLVGKNLLVTNHHVFNSIAAAKHATVEFDYEAPRQDLLIGRTRSNPPKKTFKVDPERLFVTSPTDNGLDYTFVWIEDAASAEFGHIPMERASFTVEKFDPVFVIHHPNGRLKEASLDDTEVLRMRSTVIHYAADTDYGSSGAPVFDKRGRLVALHHARNRDGPETLRDGRTTDVLNEGVKISAIAVDLENRVKRQEDDAAMAQSVLRCMEGSDTLTGYFGGLGREVAGESDVEAVVDAYRGTEQDLDIAFWNIEWLATRWRDPVKLKGAATVIADLNLDIWGLSEVSPPAVRALVDTLDQKFGQKFKFAFSEPDADESKQSTAVIWKPGTVSGSKVDWPAPISSWWELDSRDDMPFEAVEGKIFNRYPGLFRFKVVGQAQPFDFYLVPLHLKAMAEGSKRRRLASMLLARAVQQMVANGADGDWIIGGDVNDELASGDFAALTDGGFVPMSAADERAGAFTYLKSPKSLIDNIFLSQNVTNTVGGADYFIVAKERPLDSRYVSQVSDHRPVLVRISMAGRRRNGRMSDADLRDVVDRITAPAPRRPATPPGRRRT